MATYENSAQCCGHAREREFCYEQRLARTSVLFHAQSVDDNAVDNVISVSWLSSLRRSDSDVTTMRHESTSARPGGFSNCQTLRIVRRMSGAKPHVVAQLGLRISRRERGAARGVALLIQHHG